MSDDELAAWRDRLDDLEVRIEEFERKIEVLLEGAFPLVFHTGPGWSSLSADERADAFRLALAHGRRR